jgi:hypothetical protein
LISNKKLKTNVGVVTHLISSCSVLKDIPVKTVQLIDEVPQFGNFAESSRETSNNRTRKLLTPI